MPISTIGTDGLAAANVTQAKLGTNVAGNGPAFSAYLGTNQSLTAATFTKLQINTEEFDTNSNYDTSTYRFTPTVAGYYQINVAVATNWTGTQFNNFYVAIYKNGSIYKGVATYSLANGAMEGSISLPMLFNGSTDYVEIYVYSSSATSVLGSTNTGYGGAGGVNALFNGYLIRGT